MLTIIRHILPLAAAAVLLNACNDTPAPDERYIPQGSVEINSKVLIEEFTGQLCVNCPTAHAEMKRFAEMFGHENIISVSIHGNSGAQMAIPAPAGLGTEEGAEYNRRNNMAQCHSRTPKRQPRKQLRQMAHMDRLRPDPPATDRHRDRRQPVGRRPDPFDPHPHHITPEREGRLPSPAMDCRRRRHRTSAHRKRTPRSHIRPQPRIPGRRQRT